MRKGRRISKKEALSLTLRLSLPAILSQITSILMQYIDASMTGRLGAAASASIGLTSSSAWLIGGFLSSFAAGFSVQAAQAVGAGDSVRTKSILRQAVVTMAVLGSVLTVFCLAMSKPLPSLLGAEEMIWADASAYAAIRSAFLLSSALEILMLQMLQCSGDMRTPGLASAAMCFLDVIFNFLLIFPSRSFSFFGRECKIPGAGLGVRGAALGTVLAVLLGALVLSYLVLFRSPVLRLFGGERRPASPKTGFPSPHRQEHSQGSVRRCRLREWIPEKRTLNRALRIALPSAGENAALNFAQIACTAIAAPLGTTAVAAHSFAVTAEAICYMPGYGIGSAATTMVGQAVGAERRDLAKSFAWMTTLLGMFLMGLAGGIMYFTCPAVFRLLTPDPAVQELGVSVLRIELFAEPLFAASIVAAAALRGAGDVLIPALIHLLSVWGVRITLALILVPRVGLAGIWIAMALDLSLRGILFLTRLGRGRWLGVLGQGERSSRH